MAINYKPMGWDSTKFINPSNMNHMDEGIKAACDGVDALNVEVEAVNSNLTKKYGSIVASYENNTDNPNTTTLPRIRTKHANCPTPNTGYDVFTMFTDGDTEANEKKQIAFGTGGSKEVYYRAKAYIGNWTEWEKLVTNSNLAKIRGGNFTVLGSDVSHDTANKIQVTFDTAMPNTDYAISLNVLAIGAYYNDLRLNVSDKYTTGFRYTVYTETTADISTQSYSVDWVLVPIN